MSGPEREIRLPSLRLPIEDPITEVQRRRAQGQRYRQLWGFWLFVTALLLGALMLAATTYMATRMLWFHGGTTYPEATAHFKYGSIGSELANGLPYRLMKVLPKVFPEHFGGEGGDWSHFGLLMEDARDEAGRPKYLSHGAGRPKIGADAKSARAKVASELAAAGETARVSRGLPIGFATGWRRGIEVAWLNCAVCHTGVVKVPGDDRPMIVAGMPANSVDLEGLFLALFEMAVDKRFTLSEFEKHYPEKDRLWWGERQIWDWLLVPFVRSELVKRRSELLPLLDPLRAHDAKLQVTRQCTTELKTPEATRADRQRYAHCAESFQLQRPKPHAPYRPSKEADVTHWGPGRVDTFNPYKLINFGMEADCLTREERTGVSDFPSIFLQGPRGKQGMHLHWDGNNASIRERNLSAALGAGVSEATVDHGSLERVVAWLNTLEPPPSPYPSMSGFDAVAAGRGKAVYMRECASCHGYQGDKGYVFEGDRLGQVEPIEYIATDRGRLDSYTPLMEKYQKDRLFCSEPEHRFRQFKKTNGYANMPLDGLWLRAPYLHNGSVPTLHDLLTPPAARPDAFRRGARHISLDPQKGGFAAPACIPQAPSGGAPTAGGTAGAGAATAADVDSFCFDTKLRGNTNSGHTYGTDLPEAQKRDLLTYLLTF